MPTYEELRRAFDGLPMVRDNLYIDAAIMQYLNHVAKERNLSRGALIREILEQWIQQDETA